MKNPFKPVHLLLLFLLLSVACRHKGNLLSTTDNYDELLNMYKPLTVDTMKIFAASAPDSNAYAFKGIHIDSVKVALFPDKLIKNRDKHEFYATYRFDIDSTRTGLITRAPTPDDAASLLLLVYNKQKNAITDGFEVAQSYGDAGDMFEKQSWLFTDNQKKIRCLIWEQQARNEAVNNGADTINKDTTQIKVNNYYLVGLDKATHDTLDRNAMQLFREFINRKR